MALTTALIFSAIFFVVAKVDAPYHTCCLYQVFMYVLFFLRFYHGMSVCMIGHINLFKEYPPRWQDMVMHRLFYAVIVVNTQPSSRRGAKSMSTCGHARLGLFYWCHRMHSNLRSAGILK